MNAGRMNEWMNELMNESKDEWTNEWIMNAGMFPCVQ